MVLFWTNPETANDIVDIVASINKYVKKTYNENPVSANYSRPEPTMNTLDEIARKVESVQSVVAHMPEGHPKDYLTAAANAFKVLLEYMSDEKYDYHTAVKNILEVDLREIPKENFQKLSESINKRLIDDGYFEIGAWQNDRKIPKDKVIWTANKYIEKAREKTRREIIELPESEKIESVNPIEGVFFSGLSEYLGNFTGKLTFNIERPWNAPSFACVLTHESYPGHHSYYALWDYLFERGELPMEASYYLINAPNNCLFEGAPEVGINFLGWNDPNVDTPEISEREKQEIILAKEIMDLQRMYQTNANYFYNVEKRSKSAVLAYMLDAGWYSEIEAENTFKYFSDHYKSIYYPSYYYGRWMVQRIFDLFKNESNAREFYKLIYTVPQTNSTLMKTLGKDYNSFMEGI
jgi:hypothetical protein